MSYGKELILDLHGCNVDLFNREDIGRYFEGLCDLIGMEPCERHFWDDLHTPAAEKETETHLVGTSAVQFIKTSNITIHTLDLLKQVYVNIFSCKHFDEHDALRYTNHFFGGKIIDYTIIERR